MSFFPSKTRLLSVLAILCMGAELRAQQLHLQPTPFSVSLDLRSRANSGSHPIWMQALDISSAGDSTVVRVRLRNIGALSEELLVRLFFEDVPGKSPRVSTWGELGDKISESKPLGSGIGLPTSEQLLLKTASAAFIEITVPGDGSNLTNLFLSSLRSSSVKHAWDFDPSSLADPFGAAPKLETGIDSHLYGRITATVDEAAPLKLNSYSEPAAYEFELSAQPQVAVLEFEVLNADIASAPEIQINDQKLGAATLLLPDLADPGFQASSGPAGLQQFRYAGWIKCQKLLPASALKSGLNTLLLSPALGGGNIAVRSVILQLKYPWSSSSILPEAIP